MKIPTISKKKLFSRHDLFNPLIPDRRQQNDASNHDALANSLCTPSTCPPHKNAPTAGQPPAGGTFYAADK